MDIIFSEGKAVSSTAMYQMATPDPVDRAGIVPSNKVHVAGETSDQPWVNWGYDNRKPEKLVEKIGKSGVLSAAIGAKARIAIGKGICPVIITGRNSKTGEEEMEWIYDAEIEDWLELNNDYFN